MTQETVDKIIEHCKTKAPQGSDKYVECVQHEMDGLPLSKMIERDYTDILNTPVTKEKTFLEKFLDPKTGYKQFSRNLWGETIASWTTDGVADGVQGVVDSIDKFKAGDLKAAAIGVAGSVARATPLGNKVGKVYDKAEDVLDKAEQAKALAHGELPSGGGSRKKKKTNSSGKKENGAGVNGNKKCGGRASSKNKGDCAESLVNKEYAAQGYEIFDTTGITNGSGHGLDNIAYSATEIIIIETKANNSPMSKNQKEGGAAYKLRQDKAYNEGLKNKGNMKSVSNDEIYKYQDLQEGKTLSYKKCRVKLVNDPKGCYGYKGKGKCKAKSMKCEEWKAPKV